MNLGCLVAIVFVLQLLFNVTALPSVVKIGESISFVRFLSFFVRDGKISSSEDRVWIGTILLLQVTQVGWNKFCDTYVVVSYVFSFFFFLGLKG